MASSSGTFQAFRGLSPAHPPCHDLISTMEQEQLQGEKLATFEASEHSPDAPTPNDGHDDTLTSIQVDDGGSDAQHSDSESTVSTDRGSMHPQDKWVCWGAVLQGNAGLMCSPDFSIGTAHFKNKFCANCRAGMDVPLSRIRAVTPDLAEALGAGRPSSGFWKPGPAQLGALGTSTAPDPPSIRRVVRSVPQDRVPPLLAGRVRVLRR